MRDKIPALRIALTSDCNMRCVYCPPFGESLYHVGKTLDSAKIKRIIETAYSFGIKSFRFTGGEPLLKPENDLLEIFKVFDTIMAKEIKLTTNGTLLKDKTDLIKRLNISRLKISLDSIDPKVFRCMSGRDILENVLVGIKEMKKTAIPIEINLVATQKNKRGIWEMIDFCIRNKIDLKILDLNYYDFPGKKFWEDNYYTLDNIIDKLKKKSKNYSLISTVGGFGIPMFEFSLKGIKIKVKNSKMGSSYSKICRGCNYFKKRLCQEGLYNLVLTADGKLRICKHRVNLAIDISNANDEEIKKAFEKIFENYKNTFHEILFV